MEKDMFLNILINPTHEKLNEIIREKGKPPRLMKMISYDKKISCEQKNK